MLLLFVYFFILTRTRKQQASSVLAPSTFKGTCIFPGGAPTHRRWQFNIFAYYRPVWGPRSTLKVMIPNIITF